MADGSPEDRAVPQNINELTLSAPVSEHCDLKRCSGNTADDDRVNLSFYTELSVSKTCGKSDTSSVDDRSAVGAANSRKSSAAGSENASAEDRKKRCFDRYDSSESSDSGVAVLSPTESSASSSSDITEPRSPRSPESGCSTGAEDAGPGAAARMPPWAGEPAPPRRLAVPPAPTRRSNPPLHRRITEFFSTKMKPQNGLKRDSAALNNDNTKKKCLPKNAAAHDLEKYISYLSQTLNPKVLLDVRKQAENTMHKQNAALPNTFNGMKPTDIGKGHSYSANMNGMVDYSKPKDHKDHFNGFMDARHSTESYAKDKVPNGHLNDFFDGKKHINGSIRLTDPSANGTLSNKIADLTKLKVPISASNELSNSRSSLNKTLNKVSVAKADSTRANGVVSSTTIRPLDNRMNGVTHGSNNISLNFMASKKKDTPKKSTAAPKRTNRKSSACIANSKNLTWSKANNLKQVQLQQKQNCANSTQHLPVSNPLGDTGATPKLNIQNGVRQVSMTVNGSLGNINVPVPNLQNCHPLNIPQPCNGTVTSNNLASFVAVPQNVMLTTLRIPQNGIPAPTINQQPNMNAFNRANVNVTQSPTKLNGQFVFPLVQNLNGTVVQIPNLMAKMPNFVLPQSTQLAAQRQDHLQSQQAAQILINGTLLKLAANSMASSYASVNKTVTATSQSFSAINKNIPGMPPVGMAVQSKPNYTVNLSHPMLVPQSGFIVTSVPNINVKETWSYTSTNSASSLQTSCSNPIVHHPPPIVTNYTAQTLHTSSIPIAPVKPPDNPIQGTDPPSSTVKEPEISDITTKCDIPWLSKTVNNNIVPLDTKLPSRPFAHIGNFSEKFDQLLEKSKEKVIDDKEDMRKDNNLKDLRKVEEVARREETIFTQITVLKDVSSNVQNTVIEANFSSATTESSESGIGTDKSIDSPSDSQTSKECDDDSSLSLSVSVCSTETQSCQKSPILKQPKTLRFPPKNPVKSNSNRTSSTDTTSTVTVCMWLNCKREFDSDTDLLEHLQSVHVESQSGQENYVCQWEQCKVRGKPSCSRLWLERHALSHGGNKPFKCIVDGCERRFSTQLLVERHVNNHFSEASTGASGGKKTVDSAAKLIRRNGKKLRYRRQPWSARMFDFFDAGMMEGLSWRLARATRWRLQGGCPLKEPAGRHTLTLTARLAATRYNAAKARREALVTYYPPDVLEDEWVAEADVTRVKRVEIASLPPRVKVALHDQLRDSYREASPPPVERPVARPVKAAARRPARRKVDKSGLMTNLLKKRGAEDKGPECFPGPLPPPPPNTVTAVSGAKKRKMGRRHGGNCFWPCGR